MLLVIAADDVARFKHLGTRFPLSLPRNTHRKPPSVARRPSRYAYLWSHTHCPVALPVPGVWCASSLVGAAGLCVSFLGLCSKDPQTWPHTPGLHAFTPWGRGGQGHALCRGWGSVPPSPRSLLVPSLWQQRSSLPTAPPGVSTVSGRPFHKDSGQWMRAAIPE